MEHQSQNKPALYDASWIKQFPLIHQGKVRDSFAIDNELMLIIASDRLSAFDVILPDPIPGKGEILTSISNFWFEQTRDITPNHLTGRSITEFLDDRELAMAIESRTVVVQRLQPLPVEAIVRGYIIGSGWKDYLDSGCISGIRLRDGLQQGEELPEVIFTPSTKAAAGNHDINIGFDAMVQEIGREIAEQIRDISVALYKKAVGHAAARGIIIADTKFEFGLNRDGEVRLMDEILTPDSSRFWPQSSYRTGISPPSYDKQFVRDYLETLDWDKTPPAPRLPAEVIRVTAGKYREAMELLTGPPRQDMG